MVNGPQMRATCFVFAANFWICAIARAQVTVTKDLAYLGPDRTEKLDLYTPANVPPGTTLPGIVLIHGGGWTSGDKADSREADIAKALAARGYAVASINYRLGVTADPAWVDDLRDVKTAVQFLRANASTYHIDANEIGAIGGSAGGHLALMAGSHARRNRSAWEISRAPKRPLPWCVDFGAGRGLTLRHHGSTHLAATRPDRHANRQSQN